MSAKLEEHLGGHANKTHLDHGAIDWLIKKFSAKSYLDIGCGPGGMVQLAKQKGLKVLGIDGDYTLERETPDYFALHDFTKGPYEPSDTYDIGWSCEFVEHVSEEYIVNYMPCFQKCKVVMLTYAPPGHKGHHHVNCQEESYWIELMSNAGLNFNQELTHELREHSTMNMDWNPKKAWVKQRGLLLTK